MRFIILFAVTAQMSFAITRMHYRPFSEKGFDCGQLAAKANASCNEHIEDFSEKHTLEGRPFCQPIGCFQGNSAVAITLTGIRYQQGLECTAPIVTKVMSFQGTGFGCGEARGKMYQEMFEWLDQYAEENVVLDYNTQNCQCGGNPVSTASCLINVVHRECLP